MPFTLASYKVLTDSNSVKVVVRCRPMNDRERALNCKAVVSLDSDRGQCFIEKPGAAEEPPKQFTFDGAYCTQHTTEQMYNEVAYPLVEGVTEGYNGTIFAYGQTGSGKSFTMQGVAELAAYRGVIPRAFEHIFETIQCAENTKFLVRTSYLEIYNEEIRDLLGNDTKQNMEVRGRNSSEFSGGKGSNYSFALLSLYVLSWLLNGMPIGLVTPVTACC
uniref:Kinesin motor domain-containing protein n=1 Tax=Paramormyrops kingsleyae TaxID=1676925 RepID=A0A3B3SGQ0_9TELE